MCAKEEEPVKSNYRVTEAKKDIILNNRGIATPGFVFHYITEKGSIGFIEITEKDYTKEKAKKLIEEDIEKLEAFL